MKFHNGCWLLKEGWECFSPRQVYEVKKEEDCVVLCAPTYRVYGKGSTLGGVNLTIRISAPMPEVIRVQTCHHKGVLYRGPEFELNLPARASDEDRSRESVSSSCMVVEESEQYLTVRSGHLGLVIDKINWSMSYIRDGKVLTRSAENDLAYMKENWRGLAYDSGGSAYLRQQLSLSVDELIYGLGERFTPFVKNGQSVSIWNEDGGTSTEQSYKNIPFYLSNLGYGVFVNHPERVEFEIGTEHVSKTAFAVKGECLDYYFIDGPTMKEALMRYTDLTGKPALPPQWTFGLWLSTSFTTSYDEATVMGFIDGMLDRGIPFSVFHFDCCWMREFHWTDFVWDKRVFPDPAGMLSRIKAKGIKICVWINSYVGQESVLFDEGMKNGYFLKRPDGSVWQWDMWQPGLAIVDFTNLAAVVWYQSKLEELLDMGVDCFKTDFGERIPTDAVYYNGADPEKMHNFYSYLYNKAVFEVIKRKKGEQEAVVFARSATAGGQRFPVHWGGDCWSDYKSMEESLHGGLSLTSSGFGFWSHDIGGFENTSTADVYKRWVAFGLLSTHSRLHGSSSYRVPWLYDEEAVDVVRFFTQLKLELLPYLYSSAVITSRTGVPMMRSMALEFPEDENCRYLDKQFMLGESLLVAPVFNEEGLAKYYLPEGTWTNYFTGEEVCGGHWRRERIGYLSVPLWVRQGSVIPVGIVHENVEYRFAENVEFKIYCLQKDAETKVYQDSRELMAAVFSVLGDEVIESCVGSSVVFADIDSEYGTVSMKLEGAKGCRVRFVNRHLSAVEDVMVEIQGKDTVVNIE